LFHLNNALGTEKYNLWKTHLISRAAENQRYVFSVNNADKNQGCPTIAIDPNGIILEEINSDKVIVKNIIVDLEKVKNEHINQQRTDLLEIIEKKKI